METVAAAVSERRIARSEYSSAYPPHPGCRGYDGDCFVFAVKLSAVCSSARSSGIVQLVTLARCGAHKVYVFYSPVFDLHVPLRVDHLIRRRVVVKILECGDHLLETCE